MVAAMQSPRLPEGQILERTPTGDQKHAPSNPGKPKLPSSQIKTERAGEGGRREDRQRHPMPGRMTDHPRRTHSIHYIKGGKGGSFN